MLVSIGTASFGGCTSLFRISRGMTLFTLLYLYLLHLYVLHVFL